MRIGLDYRPVTAAPTSGIARQVLAMETVLQSLPGDTLVRFTAAPIGHPHRRLASCPPHGSPANGLHRPQQRWRFEGRFLPAALVHECIDSYIATANSGLPWRRPRTLRRQALLLHDLFQLTLRNRHQSRIREWAYRVIDRVSIQHAIASADVVWTPSRYSADEAARLFPRHAHKLRVLPNAVFPLPAPFLPPDVELPARYWLLVGTREPRKNIALFLQAWREARRADPAIPDVLLVGSPGDFAEPLRTLPGLRWMSGIDDASLSALYQRADRLWHPAYAEGFGLPVIEAMAAGTPVAVACGSALDEIVPDGTPRFDPHDRVALIRLMQALAAGSPPTEPSASARRAHAARFGTAAYATRLRELVDELRQ